MYINRGAYSLADTMTLVSMVSTDVCDEIQELQWITYIYTVPLQILNDVSWYGILGVVGHCSNIISHELCL